MTSVVYAQSYVQCSTLYTVGLVTQHTGQTLERQSSDRQHRARARYIKILCIRVHRVYHFVYYYIFARFLHRSLDDSWCCGAKTSHARLRPGEPRTINVLVSTGHPCQCFRRCVSPSHLRAHSPSLVALSQSVPGFRQPAYTDWLTVGN